jgi:hypothetical protein
VSCCARAGPAIEAINAMRTQNHILIRPIFFTPLALWFLNGSPTIALTETLDNKFIAR